jgi:hypothetical protein
MRSDLGKLLRRAQAVEMQTPQAAKCQLPDLPQASLHVMWSSSTSERAASSSSSDSPLLTAASPPHGGQYKWGAPAVQAMLPPAGFVQQLLHSPAQHRPTASSQTPWNVEFARQQPQVPLPASPAGSCSTTAFTPLRNVSHTYGREPCYPAGVGLVPASPRSTCGIVGYEWQQYADRNSGTARGGLSSELQHVPQSWQLSQQLKPCTGSTYRQPRFEQVSPNSATLTTHNRYRHALA